MNTTISIVPIIDKKGCHARTGKIYLYQIIGGEHDGTKNSFGALRDLVGEFGQHPGHTVVDEDGHVHHGMHLDVEIGEDERRMLLVLATKRGVTPAEIVASFIADLTGSTRSNGSDERMYAKAWLDRVGWPTTLDE